MSMFDDYDEQAAKRKKQSPASTAAGNRQQPVEGSSSSEGDTSDSQSGKHVRTQASTSCGQHCMSNYSATSEESSHLTVQHVVCLALHP